MAATLDAVIWDGVSARLLDRNLIARELHRLKAEDPGAADAADVRRRLAEVERKQTNLVQRLADVEDPDVVTVIQGELANLSKEARHLAAERAAIANQRAAWQDAQQRLDDLDRWMQTVALNLDTADYATRRLALTACKVKVRVWATDHDPRWKASMSLGEGPAVNVVATTSVGGTRAKIGT